MDHFVLICNELGDELRWDDGLVLEDVLAMQLLSGLPAIRRGVVVG